MRVLVNFASDSYLGQRVDLNKMSQKLDKKNS